MSHVRLRCSLKIQTTHSSEQCWPILERRSDDYYISHYYENIIILWYGYRWNQAFKPRRLAVITAETWLFWYGANNIIKTANNQQGQRDVRGVCVKGEYTTSHAVLKYPPRCGECSCTEKNILNQHTHTHAPPRDEPFLALLLRICDRCRCARRVDRDGVVPDMTRDLVHTMRVWIVYGFNWIYLELGVWFFFASSGGKVDVFLCVVKSQCGSICVQKKNK